MSVLNDLKIKALKPQDKLYRAADGNGLYLEVKPSGVKCWRLRYRRHGKNTMLALGEYPQVGLREARLKAQALAAEMDTAGGDIPKPVGALLFSEIARQAMNEAAVNWRESYARTQGIRFERYIAPLFTHKNIGEIGRRDILEVVQSFAALGKNETAHRVLGLLELVFNYALLREYIESSPAAGLSKALPPVRSRPHAALTRPEQVGELMRAIADYSGSAIVRCALLISAYTFCRPGEIRRAEWAEIDLAAGIWVIPADKAKMNRPHTVPLSRQVRELLDTIKNITGHGRYVFPSARSFDRPMSEAAVTAALRRMGYGRDEMTAHGFRAMASTLLNEKGFRHDVIEAQLAHAGYDKIRAIYNRAEYMAERCQLMQAWADYLDALASALPGLPRAAYTDESHQREEEPNFLGAGNSPALIRR